ncbi:hypothetical protein [Methanolapillus millepedarum]|uniref:Uncharacterized protein n=1 Tax=Methanolapillus millepedarum TaxID=3028296 RepID=A0AA96V3R0_9EURY|nr:hypothetical protein MsAc7_08950 [Methanosarcinaceae archaeon Ac7]
MGFNSASSNISIDSKIRSRPISSKPKKYAPKVKPLDYQFGISAELMDKFVQFRFADYKSCKIPERCFCKQTKTERNELDNFFEKSFCCRIDDFRKE